MGTLTFICLLFSIISLITFILLFIRYRSNTILRQSRNILRDSLQQPLVIVNQALILLEANKAAIELFPELKNCSEKKQITSIYPIFDRIFKQPLTAEYDIKNRIYEVYLQTLTTKKKTVGYAALFYDVTDRQNHMLELIRMKEAAVEANESKSAFLANMSHEIRTPLTTVIGMSEIAMQLNMEAELKNIVENVYSSGINMLDIVNHILDLSKVESGNIEINEDKYLLQSLLYDIHNDVLVKLKNKNVLFETDIDSTLPSGLIGDLLKVREILLNILSNAVKYTIEGSVKLKVSHTKTDDYTDLVFTVTDTGIGIKPEELDRIFDAFYRIDSHRNRNLQGTGLGLAITKNYLDLMHGTIDVKSTYGSGTSFTVKLRQKIYDATPLGQASLCYNSENKDFNTQQEYLLKEFLPYEGTRVLIIDDLKLNLQIVGGLLRPFHMQLEYADNGIDALNMLSKRDFDIVFLDHMMPDMDGIDVIREIRLKPDKKYQNLIVIALTANALFGVRDFFVSNGFTDFLEKPISMVRMLNLFKQYVPVKRAGITENEEKTVDREKINAPVYEYLKEQHFDSNDWFDCSIKDIQTEMGIRNVGGSVTLYHDVLKTFSAEIGALSYELENYSLLTDTQLRKKIHAIKGSSANIGAVTLYEKSILIESAIEEGNMGFVYEVMPAFLLLFNTTLNSINEYLKQ